ncbi:MAG TPA: hypothetical protein VFG56_01565 [Candidatus Saccharimonadales bacterium]|nr:hypothetical protein [Candidatus Saccharimonadales bacterium]
MDLDRLMERVFAHGVGISRSYALTTERYRELADRSVKHPYHDSERTAEVHYLGERLADRAFKNLPKSIRDQAQAWPQMTVEEEQATLDQLMICLRSTHWRCLAPTISTVAGAESLPAQTGHWTRGGVMPNCLGVAQMLVGFARATGAEHMLVNVLEEADYTRTKLLYGTIDWLCEILGTVPDCPERDAAIKRYDKVFDGILRDLDVMSKREAHHALLIKTQRGWWLVDPYLQYKYRLLMRQAGPSAKFCRNHPGRVAYMNQPITRQGMRDLRLAEYSSVFALAATREGLKPDQLLDNAAWSVYVSMMREYLPDKTKLAVKFRTVKGRLGKLGRMREAQRRASYFQGSVLFSYDERKVAQDWPLAEYETRFDQRIEWLKTDQVFASKAAVRYFDHALNQLLWWYSDCQSKGYGRHGLVELVEPCHGLASATLNHVAKASRLQVPGLVGLNASQWLMLDNLAIVERSGDCTARKIMNDRLERLSTLESVLVHPQFRIRKELVNGSAQQ